jgi:hypothetical protein
MKQNIKRLTGGKLHLLLAVMITLTACEKKIDNTIPPEAPTFNVDVKTAFGHLTKDEPLWYWDLPTPLAEGHLMASFAADSTSALYLLQRYSIINQLALLANTAPLNDAEFDDVVFLYNTFRSYPDATVRELLENPANAYFKDLTLVYLPNYPRFNGYFRFGLADQSTFNINGPVQLSLTFNNSSILPTLKQNRQLDNDFRIFYISADSVSLNGYYGNSSNKESSLLKMTNIDAVPVYANGSALFMSCLHQWANMSMKMDGNAVPVSSDYRSGIDWFYRNFADGIMNKQLKEFSFAMINPAAPDMPDAFKDVRFCTVTSYFDGTYAAAPAGTALITMAAHTTSGGKKVLEFIK